MYIKYVNPPKIVFQEHLFSRIKQISLFHVLKLSQSEYRHPSGTQVISRKWQKFTKLAMISANESFKALNDVILALLAPYI